GAARAAASRGGGRQPARDPLAGVPGAVARPPDVAGAVARRYPLVRRTGLYLGTYDGWPRRRRGSRAVRPERRASGGRPGGGRPASPPDGTGRGRQNAPPDGRDTWYREPVGIC